MIFSRETVGGLDRGGRRIESVRYLEKIGD